MRKLIVTLVMAAFMAGPLTAIAGADPIIQPLRCQIGDKTGIYVGGKCTGPY